MRLKFIFTIATLALLTQGCLSQSATITTTITYFHPYCGGARPTEQMIRDAEQPKPYAHKTIVIVSQNNKVDSVKTNAAGVLKVKLKEGNYRFLESWRYYRKTPDGTAQKRFVDSCMKAEWQKEILTVSVKKKKATIDQKNGIYEYCPWRLPCLRESETPPVPQ